MKKSRRIRIKVGGFSAGEGVGIGDPNKGTVHVLVVVCDVACSIDRGALNVWNTAQLGLRGWVGPGGGLQLGSGP